MPTTTSSPPEGRTYLSRQEVAHVCGLSLATVKRAMARG